MKSSVNVKWNKEMSFNADVNGHNIVLDASETVGGMNRGPRPKPLLLAALGGCTGMDIASMLKKMRVFPEDFDMDIIADVSDEHPKIYNEIKIIYTFIGKDLPLEKIEKAVNLSQEKYCAVSAMLGKAAKLSYEIKLREV